MLMIWLREHELFYVTVTLASVGCSSDTLLQVKLDSEARIRASSDRWSGLQNTGAAWQTWAPPVKRDKTCSTDLIRSTPDRKNSRFHTTTILSSGMKL